MSAGTMMSTGLIAGGSLAGIIIALLVVFEKLGQALDFSIPTPGGEPTFHLPVIWVFVGLSAALLLVASSGKRPVAEGYKTDTVVGEL